MTPASRAADDSTRVRRAQDPADSPPSVRVAQAEPGEPCASDAPDTGAQGGKTSRPAPAPGHPGGAQAPGGGEGASPASPPGLQGAEWRKTVKAATSALHAEQRRRSHRYVPVAKRTAYRPGMAVKQPEKPDGAA